MQSTPTQPAARVEPEFVVSAGTFAYVEDLAAWLGEHGVDTRSWGTCIAKSVAQLASEIAAGESTLELLDGAVFRCSSVVKVVVRQKGRKRARHLVCYQQTSALTP